LKGGLFFSTLLLLFPLFRSKRDTVNKRRILFPPRSSQRRSNDRKGVRGAWPLSPFFVGLPRQRASPFSFFFPLAMSWLTPPYYLIISVLSLEKARRTRPSSPIHNRHPLPFFFVRRLFPARLFAQMVFLPANSARVFFFR